MSTELLKVILFASLFDAIVHGHETFIDHNDSDLSSRSYQKPSPPNEDFDYYPDFKEYLSSSRNRYPTYNVVPVTQFSCEVFALNGYYADMETGCQAYHLCAIDGRQSSFLCPNQTIFNQQTLVCDWWYNVDCRRSKEFYHFKDFKLSPKTPTPVQQTDSQPIHQNSDYGSRIYNNNNQHNNQDQPRKLSLVNKYSYIYDRYHPDNHNWNQFKDGPSHTDVHNAPNDYITPEYEEPVKQSYRNYGEPPISTNVNSDFRHLDYGAKTFKPDDYRVGGYGADSRGHQGHHPYEGLPMASSTQSSVIDHKIFHREKFVHQWNNNPHL